MEKEGIIISCDSGLLGRITQDDEGLSSNLTVLPLANTSFRRFNDGEISVEIHDSMRGKDVYIVSSLSGFINDKLMQLILTIDTVKRASAYRINVICPYLCYSRQDRKAGPRTPISARIVADMIQNAGADRIMTVDLHADQIQGFYKIPFDNLHGSIVFKRFLSDKVNEDTVFVSPDVGGAKRARVYGEYFNIPIAIIEKRRPRAGESVVMNVIGIVMDKHCVIVDDMIDTGGTICNAAMALRELGAKSVIAVATHGVLSKNVEQLDECFDKIYISNTIDNSDKLCFSEKFEIVDFSGLITTAIDRLYFDESISQLFSDEFII